LSLGIVRIVAFALVIVLVASIMSIILVGMQYAFGTNIIYIDFSGVANKITMLIAVLVVGLGLYIFISYIPSIIREGGE